MDDDAILRQRLQMDDKNLKTLLKASKEEFSPLLDYIKYSLINMHYKNTSLMNDQTHFFKVLDTIKNEIASTIEKNLSLINREEELLALEIKKKECDQLGLQISELNTRMKLSR